MKRLTYVPKFFAAEKLYIIIKLIHLPMCVQVFVMSYTIATNDVHKMSLYFAMNNVMFCMYKDN